MKTLDTAFGANAQILEDRKFQLLVLSSGTYALGIAVISPILDLLVSPLGTTPADITLLITAFYAPALVITPVVGILVDRIGRKRILTAGLLTYGGAGTAIAVLPGFRVVLAFRLLQGIGAAGIFPVVITSIGDLYAGDVETTAQGLRQTLHGVIASLVPLVAGILVALDWRLPFLLYASAIPIGVAIFFWYSDPVTKTAAINETVQSSIRADFTHLLTQKRTVALIVASAIPNFLIVALLSFVSFVVIRGIGGTVHHAGVIVAVLNAGIAITSSQAGRVVGVFEGKLYVVIGANIVLAGGLGIVGFAPDFPIAVGGMALFSIGIGLVIPSHRSIVNGLTSEAKRGKIVSLAEAARYASNTTAPLLVGFTVTYLSQSVDFIWAIRLVLVGLGILGGGLGILLIIVAK
jgi:MFS family permease